MTKTNFEGRLDAVFKELTDSLIIHQELNPPSTGRGYAIERMISRHKKRALYSRPGLVDKAIDSFLEVNDLASQPIDPDPQIIRDASEFIEKCLWSVASRLKGSVQCPLDFSILLNNWRFGPGASFGTRSTHTADKIDEDFYCTESAESLLKIIRVTNPYFSSFDAQRGSCGITRCEGSRLSTVPKNEEVMRTIAIEPSGNMLLQLAAGRYLEDALRCIGLDITTQQTKNKDLARIGSLTDALATIDLKSASDLIRPDLIERLFPPVWYELLMKIRSPRTQIRGEWVVMNMMSTMGNGFTFPLMTLILTALIYANRQERTRRLYIDWSKTAVFGDDIIVPSHEYPTLVSVLRSCGFIVNLDKSYPQGPFRESCGGDFYDGYNVTPVYIRSLTSDSEIYVAINQIMLWSSRHGVYLQSVISLLISFLTTKPRLVPEWSNTDSGILTTRVSRRYTLLQPVIKKRRLLNEHFLMPLAIGGYVESGHNGALYAPRPYKTRYVSVRRRLPLGYDDGRCPVTRTPLESMHVDISLSLLGL